MIRERIDGWVDPARAFVHVFGSERYAFWLDAGAGATSGTSRMGAAANGASVLLASVADGTKGTDAAPDWAGAGTVLRLDPRTGRIEPERRDLFDLLRAGMRTNTGAGWVGWFGYEFSAAACGSPVAATASAPPAAAWMRVDRFVSFDHAMGTVTVCADGDAGDLDDGRAWVAATARILHAMVGDHRDAADGDAGESPAESAEASARAMAWRHDDAAYLAMIDVCLQRIADGDAYQLCLTNTATTRASLDPVRTYLTLRASSPTGNGGLLRFGDWALASASPEQFLAVRADGTVQTRPIKGTRPRGDTERDDRRLRAELASDEKERAENLMIVDLMRNDLGRVARPGSVAVTELLAVESYRQVHQLVSAVTARVAAGLDALDVVRSCFPAGSMTGAPKLAAMRILHSLEDGPRGLYAGSFGRIDDDGSLELAMVIRSIVIGPETATIGAGGGITALSDPAFELAEVAIKARALIAAVEESIL